MRKRTITVYNLILIIIILFIFVFILYTSHKILNKKVSLEKFIYDMELIQENINKVRNEYTNWENYNVNESGNFLEYTQKLGYVNASSASNIYIKEFNEIINILNNENTKYWNMNVDSILSNYCYFNSENLKKYFKIDTNLNVIVNFYTGNIIEKNGVKDIKNRIIYRQYDSEIGNKLNKSIFENQLMTTAEIVENNGLSKRIKVSFNSEEAPKISEVYYYIDENETRKKCTDFQDYVYIREENSVYFTINKSGIYNFFIEDTNHVQYKMVEIQIELCNPPKLENGMFAIYWDDEGNEVISYDENNPNWYDYANKTLKFANAKTEDGNYWVWIPRYVYNIADNKTMIEYTYNLENKTTRNRILSDYKLQKSFISNDLTGFWIAKFQVNEESDGNISVKPSQTLSVVSAKNHINDIMSENEKNAVMLLADSASIIISNDLVHYAGGGVNEIDYIKNTQYSSTGNVYGVYDLITSENEITKDSDKNEYGRYRIVKKAYNN